MTSRDFPRMPAISVPVQRIEKPCTLPPHHLIGDRVTDLEKWRREVEAVIDELRARPAVTAYDAALRAARSELEAEWTRIMERALSIPEDTSAVPFDPNVPYTKGSTVRQVLCEVQIERSLQDAKWGEQNHDDYRWLAIAGEEFGEAAQAALHDEFGGDHAGTLRQELIQAAAVLVAWVQCIDRRAAQGGEGAAS